MGQYYKAVNLDQNIAVSPWDCDHGAKLMEHSYIGANITNTVMLLLGGKWKNSRIVWAGDYADDEKCYRDVKIESNSNLYSRTLRTLPFTPSPTNPPRYLINHDRREFIDITAIPRATSGVSLHPLPLLTADGNGRGGGDFRGTDPRIGTWARQHLSAGAQPPYGYTPTNGHFSEVAVLSPAPNGKLTSCTVCKGTEFQVRRIENNFGNIADGALVISGDLSDHANRDTSWLNIECNDCAAVYEPHQFRISA